MNVAFPKLESGKELQSHSTFPHPPVKTVGDKGQVKSALYLFKNTIAKKLRHLKCIIDILEYNAASNLFLRQIYCRYIKTSMPNG